MGTRYCAYPRSQTVHRIADKPDNGRHTSKLNPRFDLMNHSPTGFAWGYYGSGPAQLALALVADATGDDALAMRTYQRFKAEVVAHIEGDQWEMTAADIAERARKIDSTGRPRKEVN